VDVGYYLVVPGKNPLIEYSVMTDADLLHVSNDYFGTQAGWPTQACLWLDWGSSMAAHNLLRRELGYSNE
jgi:hypothetical protein